MQFSAQGQSCLMLSCTHVLMLRAIQKTPALRTGLHTKALYLKTWTAANNGESVNVRRSTSGPQLFQCTLTEINNNSITFRRGRTRLKINLQELVREFNLISLLAVMSARTVFLMLTCMYVLMLRTTKIFLRYKDICAWTKQKAQTTSASVEFLSAISKPSKPIASNLLEG